MSGEEFRSCLPAIDAKVIIGSVPVPYYRTYAYLPLIQVLPSPNFMTLYFMTLCLVSFASPICVLDNVFALLIAFRGGMQVGASGVSAGTGIFNLPDFFDFVPFSNWGGVGGYGICPPLRVR